MTLQDRAAAWHAARFPDARPYLVIIKTMAELGELADAVIAAAGTSSAAGKEGDGVLGEAADVLITLLVLAGRWDGGDLLAVTEAKLARLETPGAHRASLKEEQ